MGGRARGGVREPRGDERFATLLLVVVVKSVRVMIMHRTIHAHTRTHKDGPLDNLWGPTSPPWW